MSNSPCVIFFLASLHVVFFMSSAMRTFDSYLIRARHSQSHWQLTRRNRSVKISLLLLRWCFVSEGSTKGRPLLHACGYDSPCHSALEQFATDSTSLCGFFECKMSQERFEAERGIAKLHVAHLDAHSGTMSHVELFLSFRFTSSSGCRPSLTTSAR